MLKILIVDDEPLLRMAVRGLCDWKASGFMLLPEASSGEQALARMREEVPDIVLTDIRMPGLDGVSLIRHLAEHYPFVRVLVLSNHDDFEYVREAMRLGAVDYILKANLAPEPLIAIIHRMRDDILDRRRSENPPRISATAGRDHASESFQSVVKRILDGETAEEEDLIRLSEQHGLSLANGPFVVCSLLADNWSEWQDRHASDGGVMLYQTIQTIFREIASFGVVLLPFSMWHTAAVVYINSKSENTFLRDLHEMMARFQKAVFRYANISFSIGISSGKQSVSLIHDAFRESVHAVVFRFYEGEGRIHLYRPHCGEQTNPAEKWLQPQRYREMKNLVERRRFEQLDGYCCDIITDILNAQYNIDQVKLLLSDLVILLRSIVFETIGTGLDEMGGPEAICSRFRNCESLDEAGALLKNCIEQMKSLHQRKMDGFSEFVNKTIARIHSGFDEDISLQTIAEQINVNASYLSRLFHRETGVSFIEYLTDFRVKKAMEGLRTTTLPIYEIGCRTGYPNAKYFNRVFRKTAGLSPQQYRHNCRLDQSGKRV